MVAVVTNQKCFADCVDEHGWQVIMVAADKSVRTVWADQRSCADLYDLSDYRVTSHCGGVYWLRRRGGGGMVGTR